VKEGGQEKDECVGDPPDKKDEAEEGKGAEGAFEGGAFVEEGEHVVCRGGGGDTRGGREWWLRNKFNASVRREEK
jgi:hypothetical protein